MSASDIELARPLIPEDEIPEAIEELTTRGVADVFPSADALAEELHSGRRLTVYMGIDPTAPDMHVGHAAQLRKLERFQRLGHQTILLIGGFTATIGDPTDKSAARVQLTEEQVEENARGYLRQASKILDFEHPVNPAVLKNNATWLGKMSFRDVLELAAEVTVQQMLERDMFQRRLEQGKPLGLHELMYPIMQGWDSVQMGVDVEVGGSDQIFNMLVGSAFVKRHLGKQKYVVAGDLLADPSGRKIGKTEGNMITLNDTPLDMYHKVMMWGDGITPGALELCTTMPMADVAEIRQQLASGELSGLAGKKLLARTMVGELHGPDAARTAEGDYERLTTRGAEIDLEQLAVAAIVPGQDIVTILRNAGLASSNSEARRLLAGGAVRINETPVDMSWTAGEDVNGAVLRVGKRKLANHRRLVIGDVR